jgi:rhodanese-related sulfurtransferase
LLLAIAACASPASGESPPDIRQVTLMEEGQATGEVSTQELQAILGQNSAIVFDARPFEEYAVSHIPGAINVAQKAGVSIDFYISDPEEIGRVMQGDKSAPVVLYCNGPFCGKSKRLSEELLAEGYTDVRRYQLGAPIWRALVGLMQIEPEGIRYVWGLDQTAVWIDAREPAQSGADPVNNTRNIPLAEVGDAKGDGRLPMNDHNTRIIVFGRDGGQARDVAESIAHNAFHNVSFFDGSLEEFRSATAGP